MSRRPPMRPPQRVRAPWEWTLWMWFGLVAVLGGGPWSLVEVGLGAVSILLVAGAWAAGPLVGRALPTAAWWWAAGVVALCLAHLLPLPWAVWSRIGVRTDVAGALELAGVANGWRPLTLDPDAGFVRLYSLAVPLALWAVFVRQARVDVGSIFALIVVSGISSALVGFAQLAVGIDVPWLERRSAGAATGWFANRNMFAAQQAVALVLAVHLALKWRERSGRAWIWAIAALLSGGALVLSQSRAGIAVGVSTVLAGTLVQMSQGRSGVKRAAAIVLIAIAGVAAAWLAVASSDRATWDIWREQLSTGGRVAMWTQMPASDAWGAGLGSFEQWFQASPAAMVTDARVHHLHNDWLELWAELGVAHIGLAVLAIAGCIAAARRALRSRNGGYVIPCVQGLACFALLSLVDTPLRASSNLATFALLAALLLHLGHRPNTSPNQASAPS